MNCQSRSASEKEDIRKRFLAVDSSNVADVLDQIGLVNQGLDETFGPFPAGCPKLAGWAYTIRGQMAQYAGTGDASKMEACQGISPAEVSVWSGDGTGICYFGELIALGMRERGSTGALLDGGIRDVKWLGEHGFSVFARYRTPVQSIGRWKVVSWQEPVYMCGATSARVAIHPGDFILGDEDGVIAIPAAAVDVVLTEAERLTKIEINIRRELASGLTLAEALKKYGHV